MWLWLFIPPGSQALHHVFIYFFIESLLAEEFTYCTINSWFLHISIPVKIHWTYSIHKNLFSLYWYLSHATIRLGTVEWVIRSTKAATAFILQPPRGMNFQLLVLRPEHHVLSSMAPEWDSYEWWRTEWLCVFLLPASLISTPCQYRSISLQRPGLCCYFFLKLCACTSGEVQRAFEDAIQFPTHASTVVCLLLFLAKRRGGFSLKAWSFSCFCVITEHKVKSPPSRCLSQSLTFHYFFVGEYSVFPGTKRLLLIRSLPFLMSPRNGSFFIFEVFHRSVLWK